MALSKVSCGDFVLWKEFTGVQQPIIFYPLPCRVMPSLSGERAVTIRSFGNVCGFILAQPHRSITVTDRRLIIPGTACLLEIRFPKGAETLS